MYITVFIFLFVLFSISLIIIIYFLFLLPLIVNFFYIFFEFIAILKLALFIEFENLIFLFELINFLFGVVIEVVAVIQLCGVGGEHAEFVLHSQILWVDLLNLGIG